MSTGDLTETNIRSLLTIYLSIITRNNKIIPIKKAPKKAKFGNYYPIFNRCQCGVTRVAHVHG
jgi:hypothetical protein